jgi:DNA-damage-inducible protein D
MHVEKKERQRVRNFTGLAEYQAKKAKEGDIHVMEFDGTPIRAIFHASDWHLSVIDVVSALAENNQRPRKYWSDLKVKIQQDEGFVQLSEKIGQLKLPAADGKMRETDCAAPETLFRIIQSIPSPKAEPFKQWFAQVAYELCAEVGDGVKG